MVLFIPTIALAHFVTQPDTPFWLMLVVAATAGLGGGNFASSMANISFFYPSRMKGWALGSIAAGGNIGVSGVQLLTPILIGFGFVSLNLATPTGEAFTYRTPGLWLLPLTIAVVGAFLLHEQPDRRTLDVQGPAPHRQAEAYLGHVLPLHRDVRPFIGYSGAFPLIKTQFPTITVTVAFFGPLCRIAVAPARRSCSPTRSAARGSRSGISSRWAPPRSASCTSSRSRAFRVS
jgi:NNP family nitrate/nitrite transporter-like MFS transporter